MQATHLNAEQRYERLRQEARGAVQRQLPYVDRNHIGLRAIDGAALRQAEAWSNDPTRRVDWDWLSEYPSLRFRHPKRFDLALWYKSTLSALSFGRPSWQGTFLRLDLVEARPNHVQLRGRVFPITVSTAEVYASVLGAQELRVMNPLNKAVVEYYSRFGYTYVPGQQHFLYKRFL